MLITSELILWQVRTANRELKTEIYDACIHISSLYAGPLFIRFLEGKQLWRVTGWVRCSCKVILLSGLDTLMRVYIVVRAYFNLWNFSMWLV